MAYKKLGYRKYQRKCESCKNEFIGTKSQLYCSKKCASETNSGPSVLMHLSCTTKGCLNEYKICVDLMEKGYDIFKPLSPACNCDLIARKDGEFYEIEVRTARRNKNGKLYYPKKNIRVQYLALVLPNEISYKPDVF